MSVSRSSGRVSSHGLAARRRKNRRRALIALVILSVLAIGGVLYELWQPWGRIVHVVVYGADQSLASIATQKMQGTYLGIIPRDSTFFYPAESIRTAILKAHPDIAAVSLFRAGFSGLSIKPSARVAIARWCGLSPTPDVEPYCYVFDANGYVFAAAGTTTQTINTFTLYAPLADDTQEPLLATIKDADELPSVFDFARELNTLDAQVEHVVIQGDEVNDYLVGGTRITYVLGHEQDAFTALVSAKDELNLSDGSLDYVDLRFGGKVYLKKNSLP